jgi:hypothetical protein
MNVYELVPGGRFMWYRADFRSLVAYHLLGGVVEEPDRGLTGVVTRVSAIKSFFSQ